MAGGRANMRAAGIVRLADALDRRRGLMGGAALEGLDRQLLLSIAKLRRQVVGGFETATDGAVSREVALPLCLALATQAHLCRTVVEPGAVSVPVRDDVKVFGRERRRDALGLQLWEIDELNEDVDRRASQYLAHVRAVRWLWGHHGASDEQELVRRLVVGAPADETLRATWRGGRLYALMGASRRMSAHRQFLPWLAAPVEDGSVGLSAFDGRYVDGSLRDSICRSLGLSQAQAVDLFDHIVGLLPFRDHSSSMDRDEWRSGGAALLTGLAERDRDAHQLIAVLGPQSIGVVGWFSADAGRVRLGDVEGAFERLAMGRVSRMSRLVHAAIIARMWSGTRHMLDDEDLELLDLRHHVQVVLRPLVDWADSSAVAVELANRLELSEPVVSAALARVKQRWLARLARWTELPTTQHPWTPVGRLLDQIVRFYAVLDNLMNREPLAQPHGDVVLLYAAHRIAEATDLDLMPLDPELAGIPEVMGTDLWGAWRALMNRGLDLSNGA